MKKEHFRKVISLDFLEWRTESKQRRIFRPIKHFAKTNARGIYKIKFDNVPTEIDVKAFKKSLAFITKIDLAVFWLFTRKQDKNTGRPSRWIVAFIEGRENALKLLGLHQQLTILGYKVTIAYYSEKPK
jgi:hypothetical protein